LIKNCLQIFYIFEVDKILTDTAEIGTVAEKAGCDPPNRGQKHGMVRKLEENLQDFQKQPLLTVLPLIYFMRTCLGEVELNDKATQRAALKFSMFPPISDFFRI
jgi:hypothetical protein